MLQINFLFQIFSSNKTSMFQLSHINHRPMIKCSHQMCPIRVHWHVKRSYKEHWWVKIQSQTSTLSKTIPNGIWSSYTLECNPSFQFQLPTPTNLWKFQ